MLDFVENGGFRGKMLDFVEKCWISWKNDGFRGKMVDYYSFCRLNVSY